MYEIIGSTWGYHGSAVSLGGDSGVMMFDHP